MDNAKQNFCKKDDYVFTTWKNPHILYQNFWISTESVSFRIPKCIWTEIFQGWNRITLLLTNMKIAFNKPIVNFESEGIFDSKRSLRKTIYSYKGKITVFQEFKIIDGGRAHILIDGLDFPKMTYSQHYPKEIRQFIKYLSNTRRILKNFNGWKKITFKNITEFSEFEDFWDIIWKIDLNALEWDFSLFEQVFTVKTAIPILEKFIKDIQEHKTMKKVKLIKNNELINEEKIVLYWSNLNKKARYDDLRRFFFGETFEELQKGKVKDQVPLAIYDEDNYVDNDPWFN